MKIKGLEDKVAWKRKRKNRPVLDASCTKEDIEWIKLHCDEKLKEYYGRYS